MSADPRRGDPALGLFETLRVDGGHAHAADAHLSRLHRSLRALFDLDAPDGLAAELTARAAELTGPHRLRVDVIPGRDAAETRITTSPLLTGPLEPVRCTIAVVPGGLGPHKLRDRAALPTLAPPGVTPVIADRDGTVLEAAWGNLWLREDDRLITPPTDGRLLPGVTRGRLLDAARRDGLGLGLTAVEEPVSRARLNDAGAVFITSALRLAVAAYTGPGHPDAGSESRPEAGRLTTEAERLTTEPEWLTRIRDRLGKDT